MTTEPPSHPVWQLRRLEDLAGDQTLERDPSRQIRRFSPRAQQQCPGGFQFDRIRVPDPPILLGTPLQT